MRRSRRMTSCWADTDDRGHARSVRVANLRNLAGLIEMQPWIVQLADDCSFAQFCREIGRVG